jgi:predicted dehydrogenase
MSKTIRLSVMGAGLIGKRHIEHILARPEASLASIIDPMPAARELAQSLNVAWYAFFQDIPPEDRPEGIVVATPNQMHVAHGLECSRIHGASINNPRHGPYFECRAAGGLH